MNGGSLGRHVTRQLSKVKQMILSRLRRLFTLEAKTSTSPLTPALVAKFRSEHSEFSALNDDEMFAAVCRKLFQEAMTSVQLERKTVDAILTAAQNLLTEGKIEEAETTASEGLQKALTSETEKISPGIYRSKFIRLLGQASANRGENERAKNFYQDALAWAEKSKSGHTCGILYHDLAVIALRFQQLDLTEKYCRLSVAQLLLAGESCDLAQPTATLGNVFVQRGEYERGIEQYLAALRSCRDVANPLLEAGIYGNMGKAYGFLKQWDRAIESINLSQVIFRRSGSVTGQIVNHNLLILFYQIMGNFAQAETEFSEAISLAESKEQARDVASLYGRLSDFLKGRASIAQRIRYTQEAATIFDRLGDVKGAATEHQRLGSLLAESSDFSAAAREFERAKVLFEMVGDTNGAGASISLKNRLRSTDLSP